MEHNFDNKPNSGNQHPYAYDQEHINNGHTNNGHINYERQTNRRPANARPVGRKRMVHHNRGILSFITQIIFGFIVLAIMWVVIYRFTPIPVTSLMVIRAFEGQKIHYDFAPLNEINRNVADAAIAAEDSRFCLNHGFEFSAMEKAAEANKDGKKLRGASTITQQTAKNVFLWPSRSYIRKGFEAGFTVLINFIWPKSKIMESYLNVAEMGKGIFGIQAASQYYYDKDAKDLTLAEASSIIATLPNPQKWKAHPATAYIASRTRSISRGARVIRDNGLDKCLIK